MKTKVWKDADEVVKMVHDLEDEKLRDIDREMTKKPNFDHIDENGKKVRKKKKKYTNNHQNI